MSKDICFSCNTYTETIYYIQVDKKHINQSKNKRIY